MFCTACGKELPNESRFCNHCGAGQLPPSDSTPSALPVANRAQATVNNLSVLHTFDWQGVCPSCKHVHTTKNTLCPNDASPLVVTFDDTKLVSYALPVGNANVRCLNDCGFNAHAIACTQCGASIMGRHLSFRFPRWVTRVHYLFHAVNFAVLALLGVVYLQIAGVSSPQAKTIIHTIEQLPIVHYVFNPFVFIFLSCVSGPVFLCFRPFTRFTFAHVKKQAARDAKERAVQEAIKTAKAVQAATKPWIDTR